MSEGDFSTEQVRNDYKLWGKHKWKGKFFSSEEKEGKYLRQKGNLDNDVADFLHASNEIGGASQQHVTLQPRLESSTQSKWPSAAQVSKLNAGMPLYPRRKPPRNKNLHVTFDSAAPEIMGEGGDEAELPSIEISKSRKLSKIGANSHDQQDEQAADNVQPLPRKDQFSISPTRAVPNCASGKQVSDLVSLRRKPTRVQNVGNNDAPQARDSGTEQNDLTCPRSYGATVKQEHPANLQDMGQEYLRIEDRTTATARRPFHVDITASPPQVGNLRSYNVTGSRGQGDVSSVNLSPLEPAISIANSLTPIPSPRPAQRLSPSSYPFPSFRQGETTSPNNEKELIQRQHRLQDEEPPKPSSKVRPSLRDIAKNLGDDAIEDFGARVQRFNEVFRLGTTAFSPLMDISFAQWTRTSAWWFLKGRQELESAVRGRPRSGDGLHGGGDAILSRELKQAYLDLAKAWWIVKAIVPGHPELKKYGDASMNSLVAIVGSFGNTELAEAIEVHLGIIASMRALTMSMKRNSKLPPDDFEIQGLISRVWIQYPILSATLRGLLSARNPKSLTSADSHDRETFFPITVGDTRRYFNYGSMFVEASRDDAQISVRLPCVIIILRERSGWDLDFIMASQDGQVNIMIQNSKRAGLTWENVRWKIKMQIMQIALTDGFELEVQFSEKDFKTLWGIRDYNQKVLKGFQCGKSEKFGFETDVKCFHYFGPEGSQVFPAEPIKGCKLRLFEKKVVFVEGTGQRRVHDGHRLVVVTPPAVKTLSSLTQGFGKQAPILFSYLRGEEGSPAMLLKSPRSNPESSMVITFHETSDRRLFHALLDGTSTTDDEHCSDSMPLKSLSVSEKPTEEVSLHSDENFMADFQWHQIRVVDKNHDDEDHSGLRTIRSENLRVWADCDMGTFVDRINLGIYEVACQSQTKLMVYRSRGNPDRS